MPQFFLIQIEDRNVEGGITARIKVLEQLGFNDGVFGTTDGTVIAAGVGNDHQEAVNNAIGQWLRGRANA